MPFRYAVYFLFFFCLLSISLLNCVSIDFNKGVFVKETDLGIKVGLEVTFSKKVVGGQLEQ